MNRRVLLGIAGWLAVAAAATTAGVAAIDVLEDGITGKDVRPLDDEAVHRALSRSATTPPRPALTVSPSPSPAGVTRSLAAGGGTVTARCVNGLVTIVAATPYQGFRTDDVEHDTATSSSLGFESGEEEYEVTVTCVNGSPVVRTEQDDGHRRGRGGRGHG